MSLYSYLQYLKYKFTASTRHGVHSPYVYRFVEDVLNDFSNFDTPGKLNIFFGVNNIHYLPGVYPNHWQQLVIKELQQVNNNLVLAIPNIHKSPQHTATWQQLVAMPQVRLSLDIYEYGLLLFRQEFIEKQHFVVKG